MVTLGAGPTFTIPSANNNDLNAGTTDFIDLPFSGAWSNYGSGWVPVQCRRVRDSVELQGLASSGTANAGQTIGILPSNYRPIYNHLFPSEMNNLCGRVDVSPDGTVLLSVLPTGVVGPISSWVSLSGIRFYSPAPFVLGTVRPYICARK